MSIERFKEALELTEIQQSANVREIIGKMINSKYGFAFDHVYYFQDKFKRKYVLTSPYNHVDSKEVEKLGFTQISQVWRVGAKTFLASFDSAEALVEHFKNILNQSEK